MSKTAFEVCSDIVCLRKVDKVALTETFTVAL